MAIVTWVTIFPLITLVVVATAPLLGGWPLVARLAVTTGVTVPMMTWVVMPRVTRLLGRWLYPHSQGGRPGSGSGRAGRGGFATSSPTRPWANRIQARSACVSTTSITDLAGMGSATATKPATTTAEFRSGPATATPAATILTHAQTGKDPAGRLPIGPRPNRWCLGRDALPSASSSRAAAPRSHEG
jgi:hypothetical protein